MTGNTERERIEKERRELIRLLKKGKIIGFGDIEEFATEWKKIKKIIRLAGELNKGSNVAGKILELEKLVEELKLTEFELAFTQIIQGIISMQKEQEITNE